jgi:hypothetical protein
MHAVLALGSSRVWMRSIRVGMARSEDIDANVLVLFGSVVLLGRRPRCAASRWGGRPHSIITVEFSVGAYVYTCCNGLMICKV